METQIVKMHTRLRDGTVIPVTGRELFEVIETPQPGHKFHEQPLVKFTWDNIYNEALEDVEQPGTGNYVPKTDPSLKQKPTWARIRAH